MTDPSFTCDRCGSPITVTETVGGPTGYYNVRDVCPQYRNDLEVTVCQACIYADERYIRVYGRRKERQ